MKVIRQRSPERFTVIDNRLIENLACLSFRATGLLVYLLSRPDGWVTSIEQLARLGKEGRDALRTAMRQLVECGYVELVRQQDRAGHWATDYVVRDVPELAENPPKPENPSLVRPAETFTRHAETRHATSRQRVRT